jgi:hypothetical protein
MYIFHNLILLDISREICHGIRLDRPSRVQNSGILPAALGAKVISMLAHFVLLMLWSRVPTLARKLTDANGTQRQFNLLRRTAGRSIPAGILSTVRSPREYFRRRLSGHGSGSVL